MTVTVAHPKTKEDAIRIVDSQAHLLFELPGTGAVQLTDPKKTWNGSTMNFTVSARAGFISLPIGGTVVVDDASVTVNILLPALASKVINEEMVRGGIEGKLRGILND